MESDAIGDKVMEDSSWLGALSKQTNLEGGEPANWLPSFSMVDTIVLNPCDFLVNLKNAILKDYIQCSYTWM